MLSFLELAVSPLGQFKVFKEYISFILPEALKRNYHASSSILQCHVLYKKRIQVDISLSTHLLSRPAESLSDSRCWNITNLSTRSPPSEQHCPFKTSLGFPSSELKEKVWSQMPCINHHDVFGAVSICTG